MKTQITHLDGWLYVSLAICTQGMFEVGTSDAKDVFSALDLFWLRFIFAMGSAAIGAGIAYRSKTFGQKQAQDEAEKAGKLDLTPIIEPVTQPSIPKV